MIYVFKLISGEEFIGELESDDENPSNTVEFYNIISPMAIVDGYDEYGTVTMKLRDAMLLSEESLMTIPSKAMMTYYPASKSMTEYYQKAIVFAKNYTKKKIERQIKEATQQLDEHMSESSIEKVLRELRLRNINPGNGSVN
jgi:ribosomal protein L31E